jgi:alpha/beta superfamily hydrolase
VTDWASITVETTDGLALEGEWASVDDPVAVVVLCHPHPQYGGSMRSIVTRALFEALPRLGIACLRFNFRGVEGSQGEYGEGETEPLDVVGAIDLATGWCSAPLVVVGWSFGADMTLSVGDSRIAAWEAIALPLRFRPSAAYDAVTHDPRPKLLVLAAHDEFRAPAEIEAAVQDWTNTRVEIVAGASHFFVGRTDRVVDLTADFVRGVAATA